MRCVNDGRSPAPASSAPSDCRDDEDEDGGGGGDGEDDAPCASERIGEVLNVRKTSEAAGGCIEEEKRGWTGRWSGRRNDEVAVVAALPKALLALALGGGLMATRTIVELPSRLVVANCGVRMTECDKDVAAIFATHNVDFVGMANRCESHTDTHTSTGRSGPTQTRTHTRASTF